MAWFTAKVNIRCNGKRYLNGSVFELDAATAKLNDNFLPCAAPAGAPVKEAPKPKKPKAPEQPKPTLTVEFPDASAFEATSTKKD